MTPSLLLRVQVVLELVQLRRLVGHDLREALDGLYCQIFIKYLSNMALEIRLIILDFLFTFRRHRIACYYRLLFRILHQLHFLFPLHHHRPILYSCAFGVHSDYYKIHSIT